MIQIVSKHWWGLKPHDLSSVVRNNVLNWSNSGTQVTRLKQRVWVTKNMQSSEQKPNSYLKTAEPGKICRERKAVSLESDSEWKATLCPYRCHVVAPPPPLTRGQWHKTCHPESQPGPRHSCSYVNVSARASLRAWHISLNMHVQHWLQRKHLCACRA